MSDNHPIIQGLDDNLQTTSGMGSVGEESVRLARVSWKGKHSS